MCEKQASSQGFPRRNVKMGAMKWDPGSPIKTCWVVAASDHIDFFELCYYFLLSSTINDKKLKHTFFRHPAEFK